MKSQPWFSVVPASALYLLMVWSLVSLNPTKSHFTDIHFIGNAKSHYDMLKSIGPLIRVIWNCIELLWLKAYFGAVHS